MSNQLSSLVSRDDGSGPTCKQLPLPMVRKYIIYVSTGGSEANTKWRGQY